MDDGCPLGVADAEPAAKVEQTAVEAVVAMPVGHRAEEDLDLATVRRQVEDLRADVGVHPDQVEGLGVQDRPHRLVGHALVQAEPELAVDLAGLHVAVGGGPRRRA